MKRPYRPGDLFAVLLPGGAVARGVVLEMGGRCPLLAFSIADGAPAFVARVDDRALIVQRWPVVGRDATLHVGAALSSDRIEAPEIVERRLAAMLAGATWERPRTVVRDLRAPFADDAFANLPEDAWIAWREMLSERDRERAARWLNAHPRAGVRIYGQAALCQMGVVEVFASLQRAAVQIGDEGWSTERTPSDAVEVFRPCRQMRALDLEGVPGDVSGFAATTIERVRIVGRAADDLDAASFLYAKAQLTSIALAGVRIENVEVFGAMTALRALRLTRTSGVRDLAWLSRSDVTHLILEGLTHVGDLSPLAAMQNLEHLTIRGMWQFGVEQFDWIDGCRRLVGLSIDAGARRKTIEIYRRRPFPAAMPFGAGPLPGGPEPVGQAVGRSSTT